MNVRSPDASVEFVEIVIVRSDCVDISDGSERNDQCPNPSQFLTGITLNS
jgi:hypothetical protein